MQNAAGGGRRFLQNISYYLLSYKVSHPINCDNSEPFTTMFAKAWYLSLCKAQFVQSMHLVCLRSINVWETRSCSGLFHQVFLDEILYEFLISTMSVNACNLKNNISRVTSFVLFTTVRFTQNKWIVFLSYLRSQFRTVFGFLSLYFGLVSLLLFIPCCIVDPTRCRFCWEGWQF